MAYLFLTSYSIGLRGYLMGDISIDAKLVNQAVKDAIATAVTVSLSPEAFSNFVTAILNQTDYSKHTVIEQEATKAIREHLGETIEEWIKQNEDRLKKEVFKAMDKLLSDKLGERIVDHIAATFYLERRR